MQTRSLESEVHLSPPVSGRAARHGSGMIPVPGMMLPSPASGRLSSWASGGLSPSLRRGSISSTTLRQHISLKGLLNLDSYDFVPDVDVSRVSTLFAPMRHALTYHRAPLEQPLLRSGNPEPVPCVRDPYAKLVMCVRSMC